MDSFGKFVAGLLMIVIGLFISGFVFMKLWAWFILPVFVGLPVLSLTQSIGISMFLGVITYKDNSKDKDFEDLVGDWFKGLVTICTLFFVAWITYLFIR